MEGLSRVRAIGPSGFTRWEMEAQLTDMIAGREWDSFPYAPANPLVLPASATASASIAVESSSTFLALAGVLTAVQDAAPATFVDPVPAVVQLRSSSGDNYFSAPTHVRNVFGDGERPCYWPFYRMQEASSTITLTFTNLSAVDLRLFPALLGIRVYERGAIGG